MTAFAHHAPLLVSAGLTDITALPPGIDAVRQHVGPIAVLLNNAAKAAVRRLAWAPWCTTPAEAGLPPRRPPLLPLTRRRLRWSGMAPRTR